MSYSFAGSHVTNVSVFMMTNAQLAESRGSEYVEGREDEQVLVLDDIGNQQAYVFEGRLDEFLALADRMRRAVLADSTSPG